MARHVLIAPDKLRGTATAAEAAGAIAEPFRAAGWTADCCPLSDGGEGFLAALGGGNRISTVTDPLGAPVEVRWRLVGGMAILETAPVSAPVLAARPTAAQAEKASSYGVGQLLAAAMTAGAGEVLLGLGGSAFSDGGRGALAALEAAGLLPLPAALRVAVDVQTGYLDAARVFGPQKGADAAAVVRLSAGLAGTAEQLSRRWGRDPAGVPGTGAAGGLAGLLWALGGRLESGFTVVADRLGLAERIAAAELVVTAEGRLDATSLAGKVVGGLLDRAGGRSVWILAGAVAPDLPRLPDTVRLTDLSATFGASRARDDVLGCLARAVRAGLAAA